MKHVERLFVSMNGVGVGELALGAQGAIGFAYSADWLKSGYSLSPYRLRFDNSVQFADTRLFDGLHGVFADSLPDGWGVLLMDRFFKTHGVARDQIGALDRLAYIGTRAMGALEYRPQIKQGAENPITGLLELAKSARSVVQGKTQDAIESLRILGGSPGGARPKVTVAFPDDFKECVSGVENVPDGYAHWMVKFPSGMDDAHAGAIEQICADMAHLAGLRMPETRLLKVGRERFFAVRRFDRNGNRKIHTLTMAGFMHADFRSPSLDYETILGATGWLTKDAGEVREAYKYAAFNVLTGNMDDHAKNFSFIHDGRWLLAPAYDLTFSRGIGEHTTAMMGSGLPTRKQLDTLAAKFEVADGRAIQQSIRDAVSHWPALAADRLPKRVVTECAKRLREIDGRVFGGDSF